MEKSPPSPSRWERFKNSPGLVCFTVTAFVLACYLLWGCCHMEAYCFLYPGIDTRFSPGFSEAKFDLIREGMTQEEMRRLVGEPLEKQSERDSGETWYYSMDGACPWGDFAWLARSVKIHAGKVSSTEKRVYYD